MDKTVTSSDRPEDWLTPVEARQVASRYLGLDESAAGEALLDVVREGLIRAAVLDVSFIPPSGTHAINASSPLLIPASYWLHRKAEGNFWAGSAVFDVPDPGTGTRREYKYFGIVLDPAGVYRQFPVTQEMLRGWVTAATTLADLKARGFRQFPAILALLGRLKNGQLRAAAESYVDQSKRDHRGGVIEIEAQRWKTMADPLVSNLWSVGDVSLSNYAYFGVRFEKDGLDRLLREVAPVPMPINSDRAPVGTNIFIGHGRSPVWRDLKDFISERLRLPYDEFNREPVAGLTNIERLTAMLDAAAFAFLVLTAEDETAEGETQARMNVIHEVGLFQGRLGFRKAIVLLEEGCKEFSNIAGLGQIRFRKGNFKEATEDIREVLKREGIIKA